MTNNAGLATAPYPSGDVRYTFEMYVSHDGPISCPTAYAGVTECVFRKITPADVYDPVWELRVVTGPVGSIKDVDEISEVVKEDIFDRLALALDARIENVQMAGHSLTPRPGDGGIAHLIMPMTTVSGSGKMGGKKLRADELQALRSAFAKPAAAETVGLVRLYRYALGSDDVVVKFLILYLILSDLIGNQKQVDEHVMSVAPSTPASKRPDKSWQETVYTRLRNEIGHRANVDPEVTTREMHANLDALKALALHAIRQVVA